MKSRKSDAKNDTTGKAIPMFARLCYGGSEPAFATLEMAEGQ